MILKGRLNYMSWFNRPWRLIMDTGEVVDLWPLIEKFFIGLSGKKATMHSIGVGQEYYALLADENSLSCFKYEKTHRGFSIILRQKEPLEFSNIYAYTEDALTFLNGRLVEVEIIDSIFKISADKSEEVYGVYYTKDNSCKLPDGDEKKICGAGCGPDDRVCIFVSARPDGFYCEKFYPYLSRLLVNRLGKGELNAKRIGSCALLGRKE